MKRVFLIVLDSFGVGELPDAKDFNDEGSNTLLSVSKSSLFYAPTLTELGIFNIDGCSVAGKPVKEPIGSLVSLLKLVKEKIQP